MKNGQELVKSLYRLLQPLTIYVYPPLWTDLPDNGIYFFFENGECVSFDGKQFARIVRVGTHRQNDRFKKRIKSHYGNKNDFHGNKNGSVFRKHLGGAILRKNNPDDHCIKSWEKQGGPSFSDVEVLVSHEIRERFSFSCIRCDSESKRLRLEEGVIALLAQVHISQPSKGWLGYYAGNEKIKRSGLWNTQHVEGSPLTVEELSLMKDMATI